MHTIRNTGFEGFWSSVAAAPSDEDLKNAAFEARLAEMRAEIWSGIADFYESCRKIDYLARRRVLHLAKKEKRRVD